jgi:hypothetical protein
MTVDHRYPILIPAQASRPPSINDRSLGAPPSVGRLPTRTVLTADAGVLVWWLGVHGGAGESLLEEAFSGSRASRHVWPIAPHGAAATRVVLVARTDVRGLRAVQGAMRQWHEDSLRAVVLGLVLMADAPGRLPRGLRELAGVVGGAVPRVWSLPWVEAWRVGEVPSPASSPREARALLVDLRAELGSGTRGRGWS